MDWQDKIAIANYWVAAVLFAVGLLACIKAYSQPSLSVDAKRLIRGIALICTWGIMHQSFWGTRWVFLANGDPRTSWFLEHSWMLMGPYLLMFIGSIEVAYSIFRSRCFIVSKIERPGTWIHGWLLWAIGIMLLWVTTFSLIP
jgi:hypothetical protein